MFSVCLCPPRVRGKPGPQSQLHANSNLGESKGDRERETEEVHAKPCASQGGAEGGRPPAGSARRRRSSSRPRRSRPASPSPRRSAPRPRKPRARARARARHHWAGFLAGRRRLSRRPGKLCSSAGPAHAAGPGVLQGGFTRSSGFTRPGQRAVREVGRRPSRRSPGDTRCGCVRCRRGSRR